MKKKGIAACLGGIAVGAALGVLFAPKSGKETRDELSKKIDELVNKAKEIDSEDVKKYVNKTIDKIKKEIDDLSVEKVEKIAKKKAKELEKDIAELGNYVKEKGTPILEDAVEQVRLKAIDVTKSVLDKLEEDEK